MAAMPEPKTSLGEVFNKRLTELAAWANTNSEASLNQAPPAWYRPEDFTDTLLDPTKLAAPFSRQQQEDEFDKVVTKEPFGTTTDLAISQLQGDLMYCLERAFRLRHHTTVRDRIQPAARQAGHSGPLGVIRRAMLGYIVTLDRLNKSEV